MKFGGINLKVDIQDVSSGKKILRIEIPAEDVNEEYEKAYEEVRKNIEVPGFRKGRAPRNILRMRFGEYVKNEVIENLVPSAYQKAVAENKLDAIGTPDIYPPADQALFSIEADFQTDLDNGTIPENLKQEFENKDNSISEKATISVEEEGKKWLLTDNRKRYIISKDDGKTTAILDELSVKENEPLTFEVALNVKPEIEIPDYTQLEIDKGDVNVPKEEVDEYIERMRENSAVYEPIEEDRPIQDGDGTTIIFRMLHEGKLIDESQDLTVEVKEDKLLPGFYENLIGMKPDDEKDATIIIPADYGNSELAGKEVSIYIKVIKISKKILPDLNDDFAKDKGEESLESLTAKVWNYLVENKRMHQRESQEYDLMTQLIEKSQFEVSDSLIEEQASLLTRGQRELSPEDISAYNSMALRIIRKTWIIDEIADREEISVSDEEVEAEVESMALSRGKDPQKYMSQLKAANRIDRITDSIKEKKVFDALIEKTSTKKGLIT
jgi:trigger factor